MPGIDGLEAAAALHEALPLCTVLILTTFGRPGYLERAMRRSEGFLSRMHQPPSLPLPSAAPLRSSRGRPRLAAAALASGPNPLTAASAMCCERRQRAQVSPRSLPRFF